MAKSLFEFDDYQNYLSARLATSGEARGGRSKLAQALRCQSSFISQVLSGRAHLSLEHAVLASRFLDHTQAEERFFMLLVHRGKAGSKALERHYSEQIREARDKRQDIRARIETASELKGEDQMIYYRAWYYLAIHILVAFPAFRTKEALCRQLNLPVSRVAEALEFLVSRGLANEKSGQYRIGTARIHLNQGSPMLARHHANWRMKAIEAVDHMDPEDLHFSGVIGLSKQDGQRLRSMLLTFIEETDKIVADSKEEAAYCLLLDWFGI